MPEVEVSETNNPAAAVHRTEVDILDVLLVFTRQRRFLLFFVLSGAVLGLVVALALPQYFEGRTSIIPPQNSQSTGSLMAGQLSAMAGVSPRELGLKSPNDMYMALLRSETVANNLISRFGLMRIFRVSYLADARARLWKLSSISSGKDGVITVAVQDRDPNRAAALANGYVEELRALNHRLALTEAGQRRLFFERQLEATKDSLVKAEQALADTEKRSAVIELGAHAKALVEQIAVVRGKLATKEVEIQGMRSYAASGNPDLRLAQQEAGALRTELERLERGSGDGASGSTEKMSGTAVEYGRRFRELKYQETMFELLARQYEAAKLDEAREGSEIQVIDPAVPPEKRAWPPRLLIVSGCALFAGFFSCAIVLFEGSFQRALAEPGRMPKIKELRSSWQSPLHWLRSKDTKARSQWVADAMSKKVHDV